MSVTRSTERPPGATVVVPGWSLTGRLSRLAGGLIFLAWAASFLGLYLSAQHQRDMAADRALVEASRMLLAFAEHELEEIRAGGNVRTIADDVDEFQGGAMRYQVWSREGQLLYRSLGAPTTPLVPLVPSTAATLPADGLGEGELEGEKTRTYAAWHPGGSMQIQAAMLLADRMPPAMTQAGPYLVTGLLALVVLVGSLHFLMRRAALGVAASANALAARAADNFEPVPTAGLPRELLPLARETNDLLARLKRAREAEQRFLADAAHELRTPLAALRVQAQLARRALPEHLVELDSARAALLTLQSGVDRAAAVVDQMLNMASIENNHREPDETVHLDALVRDEVERLQPWAATRGVTLSCEAESGKVFGDEAQLRLLVRNLLDNAIRHAPSRQGEVRVTLTRPQQTGDTGRSACFRLSVADNGPGIAPIHRTQVFERFFRVPGTRDAGSGLGLAIVRSVALRHGSTVTVEQASPSGARLVVELPAAPHAREG